MGNLKKYSSEILAAAVMVVVYFMSRLYNLLSLPIFTDEAIYIRWTQIAKNDPAWRFISLTDGKQPLFIWLSMFPLPYVPDPLLAGRLISVLAGFGTMVGLFFLGWTIFRNRWIGLLSALAYLVYPFGLVYDRMALYDSLVGTFAVWGLLFVVLVVRHLRWDLAMILGVVSGLGALNKSNSFFTIILLPFSLLLLDWRKKGWRNRFAMWVALSLVAAGITYGIYSILRLSPFFYIIAQKNTTFVYPFKEWIQHPFTFFWGNLWIGQRDWFIRYFGYPYLVLTIAAFFIRKDYLREKSMLVLWFVVPFLGLALFGKTLYPRYILFMTLSLLPLVAYSFYNLMFAFNKKMIGVVLIYIFLLLPFYSDYLILHDFAHAQIPQSDKDQYYTDWPSGDGVRESIAYLQSHANGKQIALYTEGTFGLMPYAYEIYLQRDPNFIIKGMWPIPQQMPSELSLSAKKIPTYVVFYQPCPDCPAKGKAPVTWPLKQVYQKKKAADQTFLTLYQVLQQ